MTEVKFAGTIVEIDDEVVAKVTAFNRSVNVSEEDITGSEDVIAGTDILQQQFTAIAKGETATVEGIAIEDATTGPNAGQSALREAAETGETVVIKQTKSTGYGKQLTGFFTSYTENGSTSGVYRYSGNFRVNGVIDIVPGS
jgi:hypothetical protein